MQVLMVISFGLFFPRQILVHSCSQLLSIRRSQGAVLCGRLGYTGRWLGKFRKTILHQHYELNSKERYHFVRLVAQLQGVINFVSDRTLGLISK